MKLLSLKAITIGYDSPVVSGIDWEVQAGEYWGLIGPNGSGKSTLVKTILGLIPPLGGTLAAGIGAARIAYVPQHSALNPEFPIRIRDAILMPRWSLLPFRKADPATEARFEKYTRLLKIEHLIEKNYRDLSGGERQKTLMARALMVESSLLILDEPTNGMDVDAEAEILRIIRRLREEEKYTILFITHHLGNLLNEAERFLLFINRKIESLDRAEALGQHALEKLYGPEVQTVTLEDRHFVYLDRR